MKFPLSWLREFVETKLNPQQLAKALTSLGIEVDNVETVGGGFSGVVVAKVISTAPHPDADKLCVATVEDGTETLQVVCGARNCRPGLKTALACIGATLTDEEGETFKIKKGKLRGVESFGMLCAADELGLSGHADGIIEFSDHLKEGTDVASLYADTIFEVSLTPNLGHCLCLTGIAREVAAFEKLPLKLPTSSVKEEGKNPVRVTIENRKECPRYACRVIDGVQVGPSPDWMQKRLLESGLRPLNNVVDITNYVLLEGGHPLHAFDLKKLASPEVIVRLAHPGESLETLDGKERVLTEEMLVIADTKQLLAIAGVMGGASSEVQAGTSTVLLESAYFRPGSVRKTAKALGVSTEASRRFERGADPQAVLKALDRAAALMAELAGGTVQGGAIDCREKEFTPLILACRLSRVNGLLGTALSVNEVESLLIRLFFVSTFDGQDTFTVHVPTYRTDVAAEIDLIEEVARLYGYDHIPRAVSRATTSTLTHAPIFLFENEVREKIIAEGLQELLTCDLIGPALLEKIHSAFDPKRFVTIMNPTSIEQSILRISLMPGLLEVAQRNVDRNNHSLKGFEIGRTHFNTEDFYKEQTVLGLVLTGLSDPSYFDPKSRQVDFYDLKGIIENLLVSLGIIGFTFTPSHLPELHPGRQAVVSVPVSGGKKIEVGSLGEVHPAVARRLDVSQKLYFAELNLHDLFAVRPPPAKMEPLQLYPNSERDWTVTVKEELPWQKIIHAIGSTPSPSLGSVQLIDIFRSEKIGKEKKNVTLRLTYRDPERTLAQEEVDREHARLLQTALAQLGENIQ